MANIGDQLLQPESGMQRIDGSNINIKYSGTWTTANSPFYYNGSNIGTKVVGDSMEFYFYGTKLVLMDSICENRTNSVEISIDNNTETFSCYSSLSVASAKCQICTYEKHDLERKIHHIKITNNDSSTNRYLLIDCIDIDEDGYMIYCDDNGKLYYDMTPIMTSNTTPSPYVASGNLRTYYSPYNAFDGKDIVGWINETKKGEGVAFDGKNGSITLDMGSKNKISNFILQCSSLNIAQKNSQPKDFEIYGSNDDITFKLVKSFVDEMNWSTTKIENRLYNLEKTSNYRYYKFNVSDNNGANEYTTFTELRYLLAVNAPFYLIQDNSANKIYNYDEENDQLVEVTDISILKENALINTCIYDLNKVLPLLSNLSDDLTLLSNQDSNVLVNGIKSTKELVVGKNSFSTKIASNIDWFKLDDDAAAKVVFSIDNGITWMTWNTDTSSFEELSIFITTNKNYQNFTEEAKTTWEEVKELIYTKGIDSSILGTLDFNQLDVETIKFAYVLTAIDSNTMDKMKNLIWQFDSKGTMDLVDTSQVRQQLYYAGTKLISNIDADMLKVNITYEGINNNS